MCPWASITSFSFSGQLFTMTLSSVWGPLLPLFRSLCICYSLLMTLWNTQSSLATSIWKHIVESLLTMRFCSSTVRFYLGLIIIKCEQHDDEEYSDTNSYWIGKCICWFMDQTADFCCLYLYNQIYIFIYLRAS